MENRNKNVIVWVVVIILLIVGAILVFGKKDDVVVQEPVVVEPDSIEDTTEGSATQSGSTIKYADALAQYADRRIQLDKTCQAVPNNVTYKAGTSIMIDNRSPQSARVRLGSAFTIKPYAFKIVKLSSASLPATYYIDCGTSQNVATVLVQK
ncbi:MAG TPA: hypothetical protein PK950_02330 [Candidatus Paceibacterota bacterium]|nr:hypothetical protein [Candidatus Paceibacterota bacterium]